MAQSKGLTGHPRRAAESSQRFMGIDGLGLVMANALLTVKFFRKGNDVVAAGFLVFAIGESVMLSGTATGLVGSIPSFAAGTAFWTTSL
ncbi:MAG TPA: hypothetical protein VFO27_15595 [Bryobacteraceae bacterium]|nr:hypothetical protein [Bryobacteraceae bacterium]